MKILEENLNELSPFLKMMEKEGIDKTIKILRILMPYKLEYFMTIVQRVKVQLEEKINEERK